MLNIYKYREPHVFLKDAWKAKKQKNPSFSMRSWAKRLGMESNAPLSLMLAGKRPIPKKYIPMFAQDLDLKEKECVFLDVMVDMHNARDISEKTYYADRLEKISPEEPLRQVELEHFKLLADPIHVTILELVHLKGFKNDVDWIQKAIRYPVTKEHINQAIDRLIILGLLTEDAGGNLTKTVKHLTNKKDVVDNAVRKYYGEILSLATEAIHKQDLHEREYNAYTLNIKKDSLPKARGLIRKFIQEFIAEVEAGEGEADDTYQFNIQLFGLAKSSQEVKP